MWAWSFPARNIDDVERLLRSLSRHRYLRSSEFRIHWAAEQALRDTPPFSARAVAFESQRGNLELDSYDPRLWSALTLDEVCLALRLFWEPTDAAARRAALLGEALTSVGVSLPHHAPFSSSAESPPHPELLLLDWELLSVDMLDSERHTGGLHAIATSESEEYGPSEPVCQEGPTLSFVELTRGAEEGALVEDFAVWSEGPYAYANYVFMGVAKSAKLSGMPEGYRDI